MADGIRVPDKGTLSSADSFLALSGGSTGLFSYSSLEVALAAGGVLAPVSVTDALGARLTAVEGTVIAGGSPTDGGPVAVVATGNVTRSGEQTIDGVTTSASRVLLVGQADAAENGVWVTASGAWARATDMDEGAEVARTYVYVDGGTVGRGKTYFTGSEVTTIGTDDIAFTEARNGNFLLDELDGKLDASTYDAVVEQVDDPEDLAVALVDAQGRGTWMQARLSDGGPTSYALALLAETVPGFPYQLGVEGLAIALTAGKYRTWLEANAVDGGPTSLARNLIRKSLQLPAYSLAVSAYGDSMTQGAYGGGDTFPELLATETGLEIENLGLSGSTSTEIAIRAGGLVPLVTLTGGAIPAGTSGAAASVNLTGPWSSPTSSDRTYTGTLRGIPGTLTYDCSAGTWSFARATSGSEIEIPDRTPFLVDDGQGYHLRRQVFWAGRNDDPKADAAANIIAQIDRYERLGVDFLVISCFNTESEPSGTTAYDNVIALNEAVQARAPREFVDLRGRMIREGLDIAGITPTGADTLAISEDRIPDSLSFDGTHTNADGRYAEAVIIADEMQIRGWI